MKKKALALAACAMVLAGMTGTSAMAADNLTLATGGTTGTYYAVGGVLATVLNPLLENSSLTVTSTGASKANIQLIDDDHPMHVRLTNAGLQGSICVEKMQMLNVEAAGFRKLGVASDMTMLMVMDAVREVFDFQLWVKR